MRAIAIDDFGGPEAMYLADLPVPRPAQDEVRIRVAYASVNPADWKLREGWLRPLDVFRPRFPLVMGYDGSGTVDAVGRDVTDFRPGDRVMVKADQSYGRWGTYAEFASAATEVVGKIPDGMKLEEAAAIPVAGLTAWHGLFLHGRLAPGQSVFIHAGSGGVGSFAVQFAHDGGARVFASCRPGNAEYLQALGADRTFDYTTAGMTGAVLNHVGDKLDLVVDAVGSADHELFRLLRPAGRYVRIPSLGPGDDVPSRCKVEARGATLVPGGIVRAEMRATFEEIGRLFSSGRQQLPEVEILAIEEARRALEISKSGTKRGKTILKVWE